MAITEQKLIGIIDQRLILSEQRLVKILDQKLDQKLDTKLDEKLDEKLANFVTKDYLKTQLDKQTAELKAYADRQTDLLAGVIGKTVAIPLQELKINFESHISPSLPGKNVVNGF